MNQRTPAQVRSLERRRTKARKMADNTVDILEERLQLPERELDSPSEALAGSRAETGFIQRGACRFLSGNQIHPERRVFTLER